MELFSTIFTGDFTVGQFLIALCASIILGLLVSIYYMYKNSHSKSLALTLVLLPAIEAVVIMMVNGNLGAGIAVAGSFSLIRFRSVKGTAKELTCIFLAMAIGIICGTGYVAVATMFTLVILFVAFFLTLINFGSNSNNQKLLKITIPESLNDDGVFDDILKKYTTSYELLSIKTVNLGSLFKLTYEINLNDNKHTKEMIDELRVRNGNLEIMCTSLATEREEL